MEKKADNDNSNFYWYLQQMVERGMMKEEEAEYAWSRHVEENDAKNREN